MWSFSRPWTKLFNIPDFFNTQQLVWCNYTSLLFCGLNVTEYIEYAGKRGWDLTDCINSTRLICPVCQDWNGFTKNRKECVCRVISPQTFLALICSLSQHSYSFQLKVAATKMFVTVRVADAGPGTGGAMEPRNQHFVREERGTNLFLSFTHHVLKEHRSASWHKSGW